MLDSTKPYCGMGNIENLNAYMQAQFAELLEVPNHLLPKAFRNERDGGRSLAELDAMCEKVSDTRTAHQKLKALKAENCENYRKQYEATESFEYNGHRDEVQLHRNQMAFVGGMVNSGMIDADDLEEE
tara:strand:- start:48 stop:431 length:384 start_codon:yes stop_codon:yes gene_type:complete